jgi:hypothetical protein
MFPPKNVSKIIFLNFKIPGKIPKLNFSKFENLMLKNSKFKGVFPLKIFQGKIKNFQIFSSFGFFHNQMLRKLFPLISKFPKLIIPN